MYVTLGLAMTFQIQHQKHDPCKNKKLANSTLLKTVNFYLVKDTVKRMEIQAIGWEKILAKNRSKNIQRSLKTQ